MPGTGHADVLAYFKCPVTQQVWCPVNAYGTITSFDVRIFIVLINGQETAECPFGLPFIKCHLGYSIFLNIESMNVSNQGHET